MCAQPCRKPYRLVTAETDDYGRPITLHDVARGGPLPALDRTGGIPYLDRLARAPVTSLKIEGRCARRVRRHGGEIYRMLSTRSPPKTSGPFAGGYADLALAFNREFTEGYILGAHDIMARDRPGNRASCSAR
jgi:putative protease